MRVRSVTAVPRSQFGWVWLERCSTLAGIDAVIEGTAIAVTPRARRVSLLQLGGGLATAEGNRHLETVTAQRVIAAPIDEVFDWCATTTNYTRSSLVLRARLARHGQGAPYGIGAVRLHTWLIGWFRERITAYQPPHEFAYVVERSFPPARHELGRMTFTEVRGGTQIAGSPDWLRRGCAVLRRLCCRVGGSTRTARAPRARRARRSRS
ncbi:MAG TPA: SRPBCC family protein [Pseudonocardiaceae bacterium]|nr:SRPBCC family protein [Pseudonocardiaceae bacterium]